MCGAVLYPLANAKAFLIFVYCICSVPGGDDVMRHIFLFVFFCLVFFILFLSNHKMGTTLIRMDGCIWHRFLSRMYVMCVYKMFSNRFNVVCVFVSYRDRAHVHSSRAILPFIVCWEMMEQSTHVANNKRHKIK